MKNVKHWGGPFIFVTMMVLGSVGVEAQVQRRCNLLLSSKSARTFGSQQPLETRPWLHREAPILIEELNLPPSGAQSAAQSAAMSLWQALAHQILPNRPELKIFSNIHPLAGPGTNQVQWVVDERPYKDLPASQRLDGAVLDWEGAMEPHPERLLRSLRQALKVNGALAVKVSSHERDQMRVLMRKIRLDVVREVPFQSRTSNYWVLVGERMPAPLAQFELPTVSNSNMRDVQIRQAVLDSRKLRGPEMGAYLRRTDGLDIKAEVIKRLEIENNASPERVSNGVELLDPYVLDGEFKIAIPSTKAMATYKPNLETLVVHHRDGEVPSWAKFIVLALHGAGSNVSNSISWRQNMPEFEAMGGALIAPDLPGASLAPDYVQGPGGRDHYVDFVYRITQYYRSTYNLPVVLVGRSFGSTMARELLHDYPDAAQVAFLGSHSNPYTFKVQIENLLEAERQGLFQVYWPSLAGARDIGLSIMETMVQNRTQYSSTRLSDGKQRVFYVQGRQDEDGGPTVVQDLEALLSKHDPEAGLFLFDCDHFVFNSRNPDVMRLVFPYMREQLQQLGIINR